MIKKNLNQKSESWKNLSLDEKKKLVQNEISSDKKTKSFEIFKIDNDEKVILKINESISARIRAMLV